LKITYYCPDLLQLDVYCIQNCNMNENELLIFLFFQNFAAANKFSYLVDNEEVGSGQDSE
jgi:hypothetical protein